METKARYYNSPNQVLFYNPTIRFLARVFGNKYFVVKCKDCKKIPTDLYGFRCLDCSKKIINF